MQIGIPFVSRSLSIADHMAVAEPIDKKAADKGAAAPAATAAAKQPAEKKALAKATAPGSVSSPSEASKQAGGKVVASAKLGSGPKTKPKASATKGAGGDTGGRCLQFSKISRQGIIRKGAAGLSSPLVTSSLRRPCAVVDRKVGTRAADFRRCVSFTRYRPRSSPWG